MKKNVRLESLLQAFILIAFALYFAGMVIFGAAYRYVHERHVPVLILSAIAFLIIGILKWKQAVKATDVHHAFQPSGLSDGASAGPIRRRYTGVAGCIVFAAALIGMLAVPGVGLRFSQFAYTDAFSDVPAAPAAPRLAPPQLPLRDGVIVMDDEGFPLWLTELYTKLDTWSGTKITAVGSVWKEGELFEHNEFALARMMMVCCAADMQPIGVLAQWENAQTLTEGEWVEITGTVAKKTYKDGIDPLIIVESVKKIDPPEREYIYR